MKELSVKINRKLLMYGAIFLFSLLSSVNLAFAKQEVSTKVWETQKQSFKKYIYTNIDSSMKYAQKLLYTAEKLQDDSLIAVSYWCLGSIYSQKSNIDSAAMMLNKSINIAHENNMRFLWLQGKQKISELYYLQNMYAAATENLLEIIDYVNIDTQDIVPLSAAKSNEEKKSLQRTYALYLYFWDMYAWLKYDNEQYEEAKDIYRRCMAFSTKSELNEQIERQYCGIGHSFFKQGNIDSAFYYDSLALRKALKDSNYYNIAQAYLLRADIYQQNTKEYELAIADYELASKYSSKVNNTREIIKAWLQVAETYILMNEHEQAYQYLQKYNDIYPTNIMTLGEKRQYFSILVVYYNKKGMPAQLLENFNLYKESSDSLSKIQFSNRLTDIETLYELKQTKMMNDKLASEKKAAQKQNTIYILIISFMLIIIILIIRQARVKQRLTAKLSEANAQLERFNHKLSELVDEKTSELQTANQSLARLDDAKSYFISLIAHELNTPLSAILGGISFLSASLEENEDLLEVCNMIEVSSDRLRKMAESSQLITQLKTDKVHSKVEPVRVGELLDEVKMYYQSNNKNIIVEFTNNDIYLNMDQYLIYKSLIILIDNAVKFTPKDENITLTSEVVEDEYIIKIIDSGPGFTEKYLTDQFKMFISDDIQFHAEGLGLGLSTVKLIMDYHDGGIRLENNKTKGATASLIFKIEEEYNTDITGND